MPCQMTRTKEPPSSTNLPRTHTVPLPYTTGKKTTRLGKSIPSRRWSMPIKPSSGRKKLIGNPWAQPGSDKSASTSANDSSEIYAGSEPKIGCVAYRLIPNPLSP